MQKFNINAVNPYIRRAIHSVLPAGTKILSRAIYDYELIYIEKGALTLKYDGKDYICREGDFVLLCPGVPHTFRRLKQELTQPHIHFDITYKDNSPQIPVSFKDIKRFTAEEKKLIRKNVFSDYGNNPKIKINNPKRALSLFYGIIAQDNSNLLKKAMMIELIDIIVKSNFPAVFESGGTDFSVAMEIKHYIDEGQGLNLSLSDLEKQFSYSKYYLEKMFKKEFSVSLIAYRNAKRLETAREMLKNHSVSTVAEKLGYSSIYAFSRAYKQHFGTSPSKEK